MLRWGEALVICLRRYKYVSIRDISEAEGTYTFAARSEISIVMALPSSSTRGFWRTTVAGLTFVCENCLVEVLGSRRLGIGFAGILVLGIEVLEIARQARK